MIVESDEDLPPAEKKLCRQCGETKPLATGFYREKSRRDGYQSECKDCNNARTEAWKKANREKVNAAKRARRAAWRAAHPKPVKASPEERRARDAEKRRAANPEIPDTTRARGATSPEGLRARRRATMVAVRARARVRVFSFYGWSCVCCGSTTNLSIDHVNGGGTEHRAELGKHGGADFWRWLIRQGFPPEYATLCKPCNGSKNGTDRCGLNHGVTLLPAA